MIAVVMAGGEGTRLRPLTSKTPKPMTPIANKPMMEHILELLREHGFDQIHATVHYLADEIESYFGAGERWNVSLRYWVEDTPLGTAGSVKRVESELEGTFLVISGDALTDFDLRAALEFHRSRGAAATLVLARVPNPLEYGVVVTEPDGKVARFLEKPSWSEVFSDTINTGIYLLEPEVLARVPTSHPYDFSRQLFPALLEEGTPLYGHVTEDYWCDIGNLSQYQQASYHALEGKVKLELPGEQILDRVWVGEGTQIHPTAVLEGPLMIGRNCQIGPQAALLPLSTVGHNCTVEEGAVVERSVLWNNVYLGRGAQVRGAVLCRDVVAKQQSVVGEGAVVGHGCVLDQGTQVSPEVRMWPGKITEPGARVTMSLVWGNKWPGSLFSTIGIEGLANLEITPEYATRLGAAFGASLERGAPVITSRDTHPVTRMTKRAIISGLMSVGANILDLRTMPCPVARHAILVSGARGGVHVAISPSEPEQVLIQLFDAHGRNLDRLAERKIESIFFREDFRRCHRDEVGQLEFLSRAVEYYTEDFLNFVDQTAIRESNPRIVVDYAHGPLSLLMPVVLGRLGCESVALNAFVDPTRQPVAWDRREELAGRLCEIVPALKADVGVVINHLGERLWVVDDSGHLLSGDEMLAALCYLALRTWPGGTLIVPVSATSAVEKVANELNGRCLRTRTDPRSLMEAAGREQEAVLAGDGEGGYIFPRFQPAFDAMASFGKLLEMLAAHRMTLAEVRRLLPPIYKHRLALPCPWERKGTVMRHLHEQVGGQQVDLTDGLKVHVNGSWVAVLPDPASPVFHIHAEGNSLEEAEALANDYRDRIARDLG